MRSLGMAHPGSDVDENVTISLGVSTVAPGLNPAPATLLKQSARALYRAKEEGGNRARVYEEGAAGPPG